MLTLEFTISGNDIQGVSNVRSLGQLLPLVVSVGTFMAMVADAVMKQRRVHYGFPLRDVNLGMPAGSG